MYKILFLFVLLILVSTPAFALDFFDNFDDNDISDWEERIGAATWWVSDGIVHGSISGSPGVLTPDASLNMADCSVTSSCSGVHAFGVAARLNDENTGIIAYVSPDHDVARIRRVVQGELGSSLSSLTASFPSGVFYELTFSCNGEDLDFLIEVPSTGDSWSFSAIDPDVHSGTVGLLMGQESNGQWDWIEVEGDAAGPAGIAWFITDDQGGGNGNMCLESGESIALSIEIENSSDAPLENAFAILQSLDPELQITQNYSGYGNIAGMSTAWGTAPFSLEALAAAPFGVYDLRLTLMADGGYQNQLEFSLPVGCGLATDLESDSFGWSWYSAEPGWECDWHVSTTRNHTTGGQYSFKCGDTGSGDYSDNQYATLETPYFNIPLEAECTFWSWLEAQVQSGTEALDGGLVQYRRTDEWITLLPSPGYTHSVASGSNGPFPDGIDVYSGIQDWTCFSIDFPDSLAGPGAVRFLFGTDNAGNREGWYIDDFCVEELTGVAEGSSGLVPDHFLRVSGNPLPAAVTFTYCAQGIAAPAIEIRDVSGRVVERIPGSPSGTANTVLWETTGTPTGVYFAVLTGSSLEPVKLVMF